MKTIKFGDIEVRDYEKSPILMAITGRDTVVWTHLHKEIDSISARRFSSEQDARQYALALAELLNNFVTDAEKLIQNYGVGKAIKTSKITVIDIAEKL